MSHYDALQLINLTIAGTTNILAMYIVVTTAYWSYRLRNSRSTLRGFIIGVMLAKAAVWFWTLMNIIEVIVHNTNPPLLTLPARMAFLVAVVIQTWVTTRIRPAPRLGKIDLGREINTGGQMVLIVEDNEPLARIYRRTLERVGMNAEFVSNGADALIFIQQETPCLMVIDIGLPDMDGVSLVLRAREMGYVGPVVAISGAADLIDEEKLAPAKFNQVLSKPIRPGDLIGVVDRWARG